MSEETPFFNLNKTEQPKTSQKLKDENLESGFCSSITKCVFKHIGIMYGILSGTFFSLTEVFAKKLSMCQTAGQTMVTRYTIHLVLNIILLFALKKKITVARSEWMYATVRVGSQCIAVMAFYLSFLYLSYIEALVIMSGLLTIFSCLLARIWLKEPLKLFDIIMLLLITSGVVITSQPTILFDFDHFKTSGHGFLIGITLTIVAAMFHATGCVFGRKLQETEATVITMWISVTGLLSGCIYILVTWKFWTYELSQEELIYNILIGFSSMAGYYVWTRALQVSVVLEFMLAHQLEIPFGVLFQFIILNTIPTKWTVVGSVLVIVGVTLMTVKDKLMQSFNNSFL